jgi:hypothetical protein
LASAWPQPRASKLDDFKPIIDAILRADLDAPRKQRHTVTRIYDRLIAEHGMQGVSYSVVRRYVADRKPKIRVEAGRGPVNVLFPQTHRPGEEAEVDFDEVTINLRGEPVTCMLFALRLSFSGKAVHRPMTALTACRIWGWPRSRRTLPPRKGRELAGLVVARAGRVAQTSEPTLPSVVLDGAGIRINAADAFLKEFPASGASASSCRSYAFDLLRWFRFLAAVEIAWERASPAEVRDVVLWLRSSVNPVRERRRADAPAPGTVNARTGKAHLRAGYASATINHALSVLAAFYEFHRSCGSGPMVSPVRPQSRTGGRLGVTPRTAEKSLPGPAEPKPRTQHLDAA